MEEFSVYDSELNDGYLRVCTIVARLCLNELE